MTTDREPSDEQALRKARRTFTVCATVSAMLLMAFMTSISGMIQSGIFIPTIAVGGLFGGSACSTVIALCEYIEAVHEHYSE